MNTSLKDRNKNELLHWRLNKNKIDDFWQHHTQVGQERIKHRSGLISEFVGNKTDLKVLEIGAGDGWYSIAFSKNRWYLTVTDLSPDLLKIAKERLSGEKNVFFKIADVYKLPFKGNHFDAVIGSSILHHIDLKMALPEIWRVLKVNGVIAFCEPNMMNPQIALQKNIPYIKRMAGDSPDETAYFRWQIKRNLKENCFTKINVTPIDFLHPKTPKKMLNTVKSISFYLEKIPIIKEIAGSLFITAIKVK